MYTTMSKRAQILPLPSQSQSIILSFKHQLSKLGIVTLIHWSHNYNHLKEKGHQKSRALSGFKCGDVVDDEASIVALLLNGWGT